MLPLVPLGLRFVASLQLGHAPVLVSKLRGVTFYCTRHPTCLISAYSSEQLYEVGFITSIFTNDKTKIQRRLLPCHSQTSRKRENWNSNPGDSGYTFPDLSSTQR